MGMHNAWPTFARSRVASEEQARCMMRLSGLLAVGAGVAMVAGAASALGATGDTRVAQWRGDKTAAFLLMFDDSWPSHYQMAFPALVSRNMIATFYINPAKGEYATYKGRWENDIWKAGMVYGNHTMTHDGITSAADAEYEVGGATNEIKRIVPGKARRLISWATPGVDASKWTITSAELRALWTKYDLIDRPTFVGHGVVYHLQEPAQMLALADNAIASKGMEYLIFHGVERRAPYNWGYQDFWAYNYDKFLAVLDGLKTRRDAGSLWITDHISYYQYMTERNGATVRMLSKSDSQIALELTSTADPELYDQPLTLVTEVPADWREAKVMQGTVETVLPVSGGKLQFDAVPNAGAITISAVPEPGVMVVAGMILCAAGRRRREVITAGR